LKARVDESARPFVSWNPGNPSMFVRGSKGWSVNLASRGSWVLAVYFAGLGMLVAHHPS